ncbi:MAG: hypothetical protein J6U92_05455 [Clostridia bacterium]|nr:hypothetical protein [Clostridia bacterium]
MKKLKIIISSLLLVALSCFAVACSGKDSGEVDDFTKSTKSIYTVYADYVEEKGETPLTYEEWLESIRGEKGDDGFGIINAYFNDNLELILVLDSGEINCGQMTLKIEKTAHNFVRKINRAQKIIKEISDKIYAQANSKEAIETADFVDLVFNKYNAITEYFSVKNDIKEIYESLKSDKNYQEISEIMTAYQELENTFITGLYQKIEQFYQNNSNKSEILSQKVNTLLLLLL